VSSLLHNRDKLTALKDFKKYSQANYFFKALISFFYDMIEPESKSFPEIMSLFQKLVTKQLAF